jgi:CheY-like chemotaxis protein
MTDRLVILLVEDSPDFADLWLDVVAETAGWSMLLAANGAEAFKVLDESETLPDLILLNDRMPHMDGIGFMEHYNDYPLQGTKPPVILHTGTIEEERLDAYRDLGVIGIIAIPLDVFTVHEEIERMLADYRPTDD